MWKRRGLSGILGAGLKLIYQLFSYPGAGGRISWHIQPTPKLLFLFLWLAQSSSPTSRHKASEWFTLQFSQSQS